MHKMSLPSFGYSIYGWHSGPGHVAWGSRPAVSYAALVLALVHAWFLVSCLCRGKNGGDNMGFLIVSGMSADI